MLTHLLRQLVFAFAVVLAAGQASARLCGDDVDGKDIPCSCGDVVVSDLVLTNDPVTVLRCLHEGLIVRGPRDGGGLKIDLNGKTLRGRGTNAGIWVMQGGRGGATIFSSKGTATVEGYSDGIVGRSKGVIRLIENVRLLNNKHEGIRVWADDVQIRGCEVRGSGRDGIWLRGDNWVIRDTKVVGSRRFGFSVSGRAGSLGVARGGLIAEKNGRAGFHLSGKEHHLIDCIAAENGSGIIASGLGHEISGCVASGNEEDGIRGAVRRLRNNTAERNGQDGIVVRGLSVEDLGGNLGYANGGQGARSLKQCEIGGVACR